MDFRHTILVLTSNLGLTFIADPAFGDETAKRDAVMAAVRNAFKPEFLNRLDDVIVFDALSTGQADLDRRPADRRAGRAAGQPAADADGDRRPASGCATGFDPVYGAGRCAA